MPSIVNYSKWKLLIDVTLFALWLLVIFIYINALQYAAIGVDTGYYLFIVNKLSEGLIPFKDFNLNYSPLSFYLMLLVKWASGSLFSYKVVLGFLFFIQFLNAILLYKLIHFYKVNNRIAIFSAAVFLIYAYSFEGVFFVLEPFVIFFGLISLLLINKNNIINIFAAGAFSALGFLCKQYGLGFFALIIIYLFLRKVYYKEKQLNFILFALAGFGTVIIITLLIFYLLTGDFSFIRSLSGDNYGHRSLTTNFQTLFSYTLFTCPVLLMIPLIFKNLTAKNKIIVLLSILGLLGFSLQFYFEPYKHYFLLLLPFVVILIAQVLDNMPSKWVYKTATILLLITTVYLSSKKTLGTYKEMHTWSNRLQLFDLSEFVINNVSDDATIMLYLNGKYNILPQLSYLTNLNPPDIQNATYGFELKTQYDNLIIKSDYIIIAISDYYSIMADSTHQLKELLKVKVLINTYNDSVIILH